MQPHFLDNSFLKIVRDFLKNIFITKNRTVEEENYGID